MKAYEAVLLQHFGGLPFGTSAAEAVKILGEPEEKEKMDAGDGTRSLVWHYWSNGFSVFFDNEAGDRFCCVEVDNSVLMTLLGVFIFKQNETELKELMGQAGFRELEEENHEWGEKRVTYDDANVDFYFEKGILVSINFGVML